MPVQCIWDLDDDPDGNIQHLAEHDVSIEEAQEVVNRPADVDISRSSERPIVFGWTSTGRFLAVVYETVEEDPMTVYVITAFDVEPEVRS